MRPIDEMDLLYQKLSDRSIMPSEWERLGDLLRSHIDCREHWSNLHIDEQALRIILSDPRFSGNLSETISDDGAVKPIRPVSRFFERAEGGKTKWLPIAVSLFFLTGLVLFAVLFSFVKSDKNPEPTPSTAAKERSDLPAGEQVADADPLGRIVRLNNVQWKGSDTFPEWQFIMTGDRLQFEKGAVEILLNEGIHLILEGPADMTILEPKRARILYGKMGTRVSRQGIGFTIETPLGIVVDQGTEFGLEVERSGDTKVVVFQGKVDVYQHPASSGSSTSSAPPIPLDKGEGLYFQSNSEPLPIGTIEANHFLMAALQRPVTSQSIIASVHDNFRERGSKKYYEIVPRGFAEDAKAYVDRAHEWNGVTSDGLPDFLIGGDLIRTFNDDKFVDDYHLTLNLTGPARIFVLYDKRLEPPDWLLADFAPTRYIVGLDEAFTPQQFEREYDLHHLETPEERIPENLWNIKHLSEQRGVNEVGPGKSVDEVFTVWERKSIREGDVVLGGLKHVDNYDSRRDQCFYGIVIVPL